MESLTRRNLLRLGGAGLAALAIGADASSARGGEGESDEAGADAGPNGPPR